MYANALKCMISWGAYSTPRTSSRGSLCRIGPNPLKIRRVYCSGL